MRSKEERRGTGDRNKKGERKKKNIHSLADIGEISHRSVWTQASEAALQ